MNVLLLSPDDASPTVLRALAAQGITPTVLQPRGESSNDGSIRYVRIAARGESGDALHLRWSRKGLRNAVREAAPDLAHIVGDPWTATAEAGAAACRKLGVPYTLVGTSPFGGPRGIVARWQADRVRDGAAGLAGSGRPALDRLVGSGSTKPTAVLAPRGVPLPTARVREVTSPVNLVVVGKVVPERGLDLLLDALSEAFGDWRLRIVGTGLAQEGLEAQAQRLGLSSRIEWLGALPREALAKVWADSDAIVAPSRSRPNWTEPTGSVVLEAMSYGLAAIVSRCGALPEVVGDAGMVIAEDDRPALTRAVKGVIDDPARCAALGAQGRQHVERQHSDTAVAERMVAFWRRVLAVRS